ncbi:MarR family transcriptional regulator [Devosia rhodophyticola]|uniref:MarR family transcriptional regulator n=1 Tax=Devosia rhodophyticola TaxID=3026423 RepID=A0ABY7Z043_9HYPH|nr:MarR family transcriptional regulator [Devosia rhodophyticola]WDR06872.1 MarR family transcriptional regulator [Devosia rhodophyticola]
MIVSTRYMWGMKPTHHIRALINRLSRLDAAENWVEDLNPTQLAALGYLAQANRFSRSPSHVADYLGTTRGTMSQTLKALERKGYLKELRSAFDKRSISFDLTASGQKLAATPNPMEQALDGLDPDVRAKLAQSLTGLLTNVLAQNRGRAFGVCRNCIYFTKSGAAAHCALLHMPLNPIDSEKICHEQVPTPEQQ